MPHYVKMSDILLLTLFESTSNALSKLHKLYYPKSDVKYVVFSLYWRIFVLLFLLL